MDFDFSSDQQMLRDSVHKWAAEQYDFGRYLQIVQRGGFSQDHWTQLGDLGLTALAVPLDHGGLNMGPIDAMVVAEELGRAMVCEPWSSVCLASVAILRDNSIREIADPWLTRIAQDHAKVVIAMTEPGARYELSYCNTKAIESNGKWVLTGIKSLVPLGDQADAWIIPAATQWPGAEPKISLFLLTNPGKTEISHPTESHSKAVSTRSYVTQDGSRAGELWLQKASAVLLCENGLPALERAADIQRAALCAQAVGAMEHLLALTTDYLSTRKQFGVAIGTFQALRHRVADMKMNLELARSMSYFAHLRLTASAQERSYAVAAAKYQIGQSARFVGQQAVQLHGGIGVTHEYIVGHLFKYLTAIELSLGDSNHQLGKVAQQMGDLAGVFQ